ncbi:disease resistance protein RPP13-like [Prosopis cineraria]|uniref:disease resistance protein RPP13-like n=1 Tax=Prosopis cineraria TaxID=364024 RepID=UPI00241018C6|nr:disease resistance protein RPP13-like [Prosopis cineraria]
METLNALLKDLEQRVNKYEVIAKGFEQPREVVYEAEDLINTYIYDLNRQRIKRWWDMTNCIIMADGAVSFLLEKLSGQLLQEYNLPSRVKKKIELLQDQMEILKPLLNCSEKSLKTHEVITNAFERLTVDVHEAEDMIDTYIYNLNRQRIKRWWNLTNYASHRKLLHDLEDKIGEIEERIENIQSTRQHAMEALHNVQGEAEIETEMDAEAILKERRRNVEQDDVVGFDVCSNEVIKRLMGGHKERKVVSIIGMGGQGKTTLARKIYKNDKLKRCFDTFAWADVSEDWKAEALLLILLAQVGSSSYHGKGIENLRQAIQKELDDGYFQNISMENLLKQKIHESLREKQYFVVLDDIWRPEVWHAINDAFPVDKNGSRILITSRDMRVARVASASEEFIYKLPSLNEEQSWELLSKRVFGGEQCPPDLEDLGRKMAESCDGLPLSIVVLAGILAQQGRSKARWFLVAGNEIWHLSQQKVECTNILALSYKFLPQNLKPCFLYVGHYPEDFKISVKQLIRLWIAEGLIPQDTGTKQLEDVAEYYLMELIDRSLIQVEEKRTDGGVKVCRIHDLLRAFCIKERKKQKFYDIITTTGSSNPGSPRRLFVYQKPSTCLTSSLSANHSPVRSLIFFERGEDFTHWEAILKDVKLVQILDISSSYMERRFPNTIKHLIHLRYLKLCNVDPCFGRIPKAIFDLWNLETFQIVGFSVTLPRSIEKFKCLKHLLLPRQSFIPRLNGSSKNLEILSGAAFEDSHVPSLTHMPKLRKLGMFLSKEVHNSHTFWQNLPALSDLQTLKIWGYNFPRIDAIFPSKLTKITMQADVDDISMEVLGAISSLEILKIGHYSLFNECRFDNLDCKSGYFQNLKVFKKRYMKYKRWNLSRGAMPRLQNLSINYCQKLIKLPEKLWSLPHLRNVEVPPPGVKSIVFTPGV